ncbi:hypothetical protein D3C74_241990 [compost metagenome]
MLHDAKVVGDKDIRQAEFLLQILKQVHHLRLDRHVERRDGLVGDDQLRLQGQRPCNANPLPLSAGELMRITLQMTLCQAHDVD